jgi:ABC-type glycerol-3-phosphate transport system substrate-binding protein
MARHTVFVLLIAALAATGCGPGGADSGDGDRATITFWHSFTQSTRPALDKLIERFHEDHPDIRIQPQYVPTGDALAQKLITSVQSGSAPDISWIHSHYLEDLSAADAVYEMAHFIDGPNGLSEEEMADMYPALLEYASWQGTLYSMPMEATNLGLIYNKTHFEAAGLDPEAPPETWEELRAFSRALSMDDNGDGRYERIGFFVPAVPASGPQGSYMMWQWTPFLWQAGGHLVDTSQTDITWDEPAGVEALSLWQSVYQMQNQRTFTSEDPLTVMASQQISMMLDGPWNLPRYPELFSQFDWGVAMLPEGPAKRATVVAGEYLAIFKQSAFPDEAWTFVKWMIQPETQAFWSMESGYLPVRQSVVEVPEFQRFLDANPPQRAFVEQMAYAQAQRPIDFNTIRIQRLLAEAIERATVGAEPPDRVLSETASEAEMLLQEGRAGTASR